MHHENDHHKPIRNFLLHNYSKMINSYIFLSLLIILQNVYMYLRSLTVVSGIFSSTCRGERDSEVDSDILSTNTYKQITYIIRLPYKDLCCS